MADIYLMVVFFLICNTGGACGDIVGSLPSRGLLPPGKAVLAMYSYSAISGIVGELYSFMLHPLRL